MRRLMPPARSFLIQSGQMAALLAVAVLAMAAAPMAPGATAPEAGSTPAAPPVIAVAEPAGPMTRPVVFEAPVRGYSINSKFGLRRLGGEPGARQHKAVSYTHLTLPTKRIV